MSKDNTVSNEDSLQNTSSLKEISLLSPKELSLLLRRITSQQHIYNALKMNNIINVKNRGNQSSKLKSNLLKIAKRRQLPNNSPYSTRNIINVTASSTFSPIVQYQKLFFGSPQSNKCKI